MEVVAVNTTLVVSRKRARDDDGASAGSEISTKADGTSVLSGQRSPESGVEDKLLLEERETGLAQKESDPGKGILRVKQIKVSAAIIASESSYFKKLLGNGMKETDENVVSIRVTEEEVEAFEELIHYIYKEKFIRTEPHHLLKIVVAADKFQVNRAAIFCAELMLESEMTTESAVIYLDCPVELEVMASVKVAARGFLVNSFKEVLRHEEVLLKMPLSAIKSIFSSSELVVPSEDTVYTFLLKWASGKYLDQNEIRAVFRSELMCLIRFMHMSAPAIKQFAGSHLTDMRLAISTIVNALQFKTNSPHTPVSDWNYEKRFYLVRPVKIVNLDPFPGAAVYLDLSLQDCLRMTIPGKNIIDSEMFWFAGFWLTVKAIARIDPATKSPSSLGLFLAIHPFTRPSINAEIAFSVRQMPSEDYITKDKIINTTFASDKVCGNYNVFQCSWAQLTGEASPFVIGGRIYIRVEVKIKQP